MSGAGDNKTQSGPFAHEQEIVDYIVANFDSLAMHPDPAEKDSDLSRVPCISDDTEFVINGVKKRLGMNIYRLEDPKGSSQYKYMAGAKKLGAGANSKVMLWLDINTGEKLAAKIMKNLDDREAVLMEAKRFNRVYKILRDGKYSDSGEVFYTKKSLGAYEKKQPNIKIPNSLVFSMPMFPGRTLDEIGDRQHKSHEPIAQLSLLAIPKKPGAKAIERPLRSDSVVFDGGDHSGDYDGYNKEPTAEEEFDCRIDETKSQLKGDFLTFPEDMYKYDINGYTEIFQEKCTTKEQLDAEVKESLHHFVMRDPKPLFDMQQEKEGKLPPIDQNDFDENFDYLLSVFKQMLEIISIVHEIGIVVNDLKPENFIIDEDGQICIIDFGEATDIEKTESVLEDDFKFHGTVPYMTPENIQALINNKVYYPEADKARKLLALMAIYEQRGIEIPSELKSLDKDKLKQTASQVWKYKYNTESDAYALGTCGEIICTLLIPDTSKLIPDTSRIINPTPGLVLPASIFTFEGDPRAAKINQLLKITKGLRCEGEPQMSVGDAITQIDALRTQHQESMKLKPKAAPAVPKKPIDKKTKIAKKVTFELTADKYLQRAASNGSVASTETEPTSTTNADISVEPVTPNPAATFRKRRFGSGLPNIFSRNTRTIKGLTPGEISDIREAFKALEKNTGTKASFIAKDTLFQDGATKIPCPYDCYRLANGVIIAKTTFMIGKGATAEVFRGIDIYTGAAYAIKIPKYNGENSNVDVDKSNTKTKVGNKLMADIDAAMGFGQDDMYETITVNGLEVAIMPEISGQQLGKKIAAHKKIFPVSKQKIIKPEQRQRSPSEYDLSPEESEQREKQRVEINPDIMAEQKESQVLNPVKYYKDELKKAIDDFGTSDFGTAVSDVINKLNLDGFIEKKSGSISLNKELIVSYLPDSLIEEKIQKHLTVQEKAVEIKDPEVFLKTLLDVASHSQAACMSVAKSLSRGVVNRDIKPENMIITEEFLKIIDYDEYGSFEKDSEFLFGRFQPKGTPNYFSPYNSAVYQHLITNIGAINAARKALAIYDILQERNELNSVDAAAADLLFSEENVKLLRILAYPPDFIWNAQSEANALGLSAEEYSQICFDKRILGITTPEMPTRITSSSNEPCVAAFNKFLEITKKLLNPDVKNTYVADQAAADFEILAQRIKALQDVRQQLQHPQATTLVSRIASQVKPFLQTGATVKTTTDMTRQSPAWDNAIQTLAVDLDPTKHQVEVKADKSVSIKSKNTKKSVGSLALVEGTVYGNTSDADAFEQMLKVYIASHKPGEQVHIEIIGLSDVPELAIRFQEIASNLKVVAPFDAETAAAVTKWQQQKKSTDPKQELEI